MLPIMRRWIRNSTCWLIAVGVMVTVGVLLSAQAPQVRTGVVLDAVTLQGVEGALVAVRIQPADGSRATVVRVQTGSGGRFDVPNVPPLARVVITATKPGYLRAEFADSVPAAPEPALPSGLSSSAREWQLRAWKSSTITGRVTNERGDPVVGVPVRSFGVVWVAGRRQMVQGPLASTDDRGQYRLIGLNPGAHVVLVPSIQQSLPIRPAPVEGLDAGGLRALDAIRGSAASADAVADLDYRILLGRFAVPPPPQDGRVFVYPPTFYPGTSTWSDAQAIEVSVAQNVVGADVVLMPVSAHRVTGTIDNWGAGRGNLALRLSSVGAEAVAAADAATTFVSSDGSFAFPRVPAGRYWLHLAGNVTELTTGPVDFEASASEATPGVLSIGTTTRVAAVGGPSARIVTTLAYGGSAVHGGVEVHVGPDDARGVSVPLLATRSLRGTVVALNPGPAGPSGRPLSSRIFADPIDGDLLRVQSVETTGTGQDFSISGLRPGKYWIRLDNPTGWHIKSVRWQQRDVSGIPMEIDTSDIEGLVVEVAPEAAIVECSVNTGPDSSHHDWVVVLFPSNKLRWTDSGLNPPDFRVQSLGSDGTTRFTDVPPGQYYVAAAFSAGGVRHAIQMNPEALARLSESASQVSVPPGGSGVVALDAGKR